MRSADSVSGLRGGSEPLSCGVCSQKVVERTPATRAKAHRMLLRKVKTNLEVVHQKEQV